LRKSAVGTGVIKFAFLIFLSDVQKNLPWYGRFFYGRFAVCITVDEGKSDKTLTMSKLKP